MRYLNWIMLMIYIWWRKRGSYRPTIYRFCRETWSMEVVLWLSSITRNKKCSLNSDNWTRILEISSPKSIYCSPRDTNWRVKTKQLNSNPIILRRPEWGCSLSIRIITFSSMPRIWVGRKERSCSFMIVSPRPMFLSHSTLIGRNHVRCKTLLKCFSQVVSDARGICHRILRIMHRPMRLKTFPKRLISLISTMGR